MAYKDFPDNDESLPYDIGFCMMNCDLYSRDAFDKLKDNSSLNIAYFGCLGYCRDPCNLRSFAIIANPYTKQEVMVQDDNNSELVRKILKIFIVSK